MEREGDEETVRSRKVRRMEIRDEEPRSGLLDSI